MAIIEGELIDQGGAIYHLEHSAYSVPIAGTVNGVYRARPSEPSFKTGGSTASSDILTGPAGSFAPGDLYKHVWVRSADEFIPGPGALPVTINLHRTIIQVLSSSQVRMSAPAGRTVSGAEFGFDWDSTPSIQAAIDAAYAAGGGRVLLHSGRVYSVMEIYLRPGVTLDLNGSTLKRFPYAPVRTLVVPEGLLDPYHWGDDTDSAPVTVCNGVVDGFRAKQGPYEDYEQQGATLMFFDGAGNSPFTDDGMGTITRFPRAGRLRVNIENMVLQDSVADGITLYRNVDASITNVRAVDCWRGGLVAAAGYTRVRVDRFYTGGQDHDSGIDLEVDQGNAAEGHNGSTALDVQLNSVWIQGDLDVELQPGSILIADNIICRRPGFLLGALGSTVRISNSEFVVGEFDEPGANGNRVVFPHDVTFTGCTFTVQPGEPDPGKSFKLAGVRAAFRAGLAPSGQKLRLVDCKFKLGPTVKAGDATYGVWVEEDALTLNNELIVEGCDIPNDFDVGLYSHFGLRATVRDSRIRAAKPFHWNANEGASGLDLTIDDVDVRGAGFYMDSGFGRPGSGVRRLEHRNTYVAEADCGLSAPNYFDEITFVGGRVIRVASSPVGRLSGMPGDVAELAVPVAGDPWRWVCTSTTPTAGVSVWKAMAALES